MARKTHMVIHFMDGTKLVLRYPRLQDKDAASIATAVRKALDAEKIVVEVDDSLLVIPVRNIKYVQVTPPPDALPSGVFRNAEIVE
jgi:hypothetical protein